MISGRQSIKFGLDRCPKKQNNAASNLEIYVPHIFHKNNPKIIKSAMKYQKVLVEWQRHNKKHEDHLKKRT